MDLTSRPDGRNKSIFSDVLGSFLLVLVFLGIVDYRSAHPELSNLLPQDSRSLLGAEYDSIARAIRQGRGFSDPFEEQSGPTAWMTPILPYLLAGIYWCADDDRSTVVEVIVVLQMLSNVATCLLVLRVARSLNASLLGYASIVVVLIVNLLWLFQRTHDVWLLLLIYNFIWVGAFKLWSRPNTFLGAVGWGLCGGLIALCSPVAGFTWAVVTSVTNVASGLTPPRLRLFAIAAVSSILVVSPWAIRNRLVLDYWIPIKSNFAYEVWQAQCVDDDGVLDSSTFSKHPWPNAGQERRRYVEVGEIEFVSSRWPIFRAAVARSPRSFVQRVVNRFTAATWYYETTFQAHERLWITSIQRGLFWLPFLGLLMTAAFKSRVHRIARGGDLAVLISVCGLVVYICFSYYQRYSAPLAGIQMLLMVHGFAKLRQRLWPPARGSNENKGNNDSIGIHAD